MPLLFEKLAVTTEPFWRADLLSRALTVAARHRDWPTFEERVSDYRSLPVSFRSGHEACVILNLEGVRALDDGRVAEAERIMAAVVAMASSLELLSNNHVSMLAKRLWVAGLAPELCDAFDRITQQRDWRVAT